MAWPFHPSSGTASRFTRTTDIQSALCISGQGISIISFFSDLEGALGEVTSLGDCVSFLVGMRATMLCGRVVGRGKEGMCACVCMRVCVRVGWIGTLSFFQVSTHTQKHPPRPPYLSDSVNLSQRESLQRQPSSPTLLLSLPVHLSRF